jgi:hypothetical protein
MPFSRCQLIAENPQNSYKLILKSSNECKQVKQKAAKEKMDKSL